jgi:integrase
MPRARTGTLVPPGADGFWRARVTKEHADGTKTRPLYLLGTTDKAIARRKLARLNALILAGHDPHDAAIEVGTPERVKDYADAWFVKREAQGVVNVEAERRTLAMHALDAIGHLPLCDVHPPHVRGILDDLAAETYEKGRVHVVEHRYRGATVTKLRAILHALFRSAQEAGLVEHNPVTPVRTPKTRETRKERAILTDEEFSRFVGCAEVDLELRMLSLVARCEGGMRAGDLNRWDWTMLDRVDFSECFIPRAKTRTPQALAIPDVLAPFLRAWWERAGKPESGPVFPSRRGKRAGDFRQASGGFAYRLRRELFRAGVYRMPPVEVPATKPGQRTDLGKPVEGKKLAPNPRDPLYFETATTLPVDWHSFRRAFASALADAGVNAQHAMILSAHSDPRVHARYVMRTAAMRAIPDAALPRLPAGGLVEAAEAPGNVTVRDDSTPLPFIAAEKLNDLRGRSRDRTCDFVRVKDALYR